MKKSFLDNSKESNATIIDLIEINAFLNISILDRLSIRFLRKSRFIVEFYL